MADNDSLLNEALGDPAVLVSLFVVLVLDAFLNATSVPRLSKHPHDHLFFFFFFGVCFHLSCFSSILAVYILH